MCGFHDIDTLNVLWIADKSVKYCLSSVAIITQKGKNHHRREAANNVFEPSVDFLLAAVLSLI